jgi:hypothetical protein
VNRPYTHKRLAGRMGEIGPAKLVMEPSRAEWGAMARGYPVNVG